MSQNGVNKGFVCEAMRADDVIQLMGKKEGRKLQIDGLVHFKEQPSNCGVEGEIAVEMSRQYEDLCMK